MCGIIGYLSWIWDTNSSTSLVSSKADFLNLFDTDTKLMYQISLKETIKILVRVLKRLEYRGYDSAGVALINNKVVERYRTVGNISKLKERLNKYNEENMNNFRVGIGHTRWATHGPATESNAHPHKAGKLYIVHNGIIENCVELKSKMSKNIKYESQTDTEILGYWLLQNWTDNVEDLPYKISQCLNQVQGTFGLCIMDSENPKQLIAIRRGSPLVIGKTQNEYYISSDPSALIGMVKNIFYLDDNEMAICRPNHFEILNICNMEKSIKEPSKLNLESEYINKDGYPHFLIKEIKEQPKALKTLLLGRFNPLDYNIKIGGLTSTTLDWIKNLIILGCGSAYYAGWTAKYILESILPISIQVELASEYRYRKSYIIPQSFGIIVSQSGETADTLESLKQLKENNIYTFGIVNVVGSTISRKVDNGLYIHAGPEFSVASTKAFTNQLLSIILLGLYIIQDDLDINILYLYKQSIEQLPNLIQTTINSFETYILEISQDFKDYKNALYLARNNLHPIAMEGALKLKEIAYIHAEGFSASELKHGPIALIDDSYFIVFLLPKGLLYNKTYNNLEQVLARLRHSKTKKKQILLITDASKNNLKDFEDYIYQINLEELKLNYVQQPFIFNVILQLLAYHIAKLKGYSIDQPRHLAKSVTVE